MRALILCGLLLSLAAWAAETERPLTGQTDTQPITKPSTETAHTETTTSTDSQPIVKPSSAGTETTSSSATHAGSGAPSTAAHQAGNDDHGAVPGTPAGAAQDAGHGGSHIDIGDYREHDHDYYRDRHWRRYHHQHGEIIIICGQPDCPYTRDGQPYFPPERRSPYRGFLGISGGAHGVNGGASIGLEWIGTFNTPDPVLGVGIFGTGTASDKPSGVLDYDLPHDGYAVLGGTRTDTAGLYGVIVKPVTGRLYLRGLLGYAERREGLLVQSDTTGWLYNSGARKETLPLLGVGIALIPGVTLDVDTVRGVSLGISLGMR